jgi:hypothetical protein
MGDETFSLLVDYHLSSKMALLRPNCGRVLDGVTFAQ